MHRVRLLFFLWTKEEMSRIEVGHILEDWQSNKMASVIVLLCIVLSAEEL